MPGGATVGAPAGGMQGRAGAMLVLAAGVLIAASSSIMVRYAQQAGLSSLLISAGRMTIAVLLLTPLVLWKARAELQRLAGRDWMIGAAAGAFLAAHFATWISSLEYTSVASSAALVTTNPIWVGIASWLFLRERIARPAVIGIGLSIAGSLAILLGDAPGAGSEAPLLGNLLALAGAVTVSGYFLIGRSLRDRVSLLAYVWIAYGAAALFLVGAALVEAGWAVQAAGAGFGPELGSGLAATSVTVGWLCVLGLAIGPQLLGHTAFNWSLRRLSATFVAISILGEPLGSAFFAWLLFGEGVSGTQAVGFALLLCGIVVASLAERR